MLRGESHLDAIAPRGGRLRQRDPGRGHDDISTTTAPRFLLGRRPSAAGSGAAPAAVAAGRRRLVLTGHRRPFAASSAGTPRPQPASGGSSGPSSDGGGSSSSSSMSSAPLLGGEATGGEPASSSSRPSSWVERVVDTAEARTQLGFAVPMVLTSMAYYGIPLVSVMFSGHLGDVHLAGATLGNSWATVTGYAFVVSSSEAVVDGRVKIKQDVPC